MSTAPDCTQIPSKLKELQLLLLDIRKQQALYLQSGDVGFGSAPSNIAILKYWGKSLTGLQIPLNSSLSFTIGSFRSSTVVTVQGRFHPLQSGVAKPRLWNHSIQLNDSMPIKADVKLAQFLDRILDPWGSDIAFAICSKNNFPTACGIASSASGYAALTAAIADLLQLKKYFSQTQLEYWLCEWSRLGSGSATRSALNSKFVSWELHNDKKDSQQPFTTTQAVQTGRLFDTLQHCILVVDAQSKAIPSSEGHSKVTTSPFHTIRLAKVKTQWLMLLKALKNDDFTTVSQIAEEDALLMHSIMQTSTPPQRYLSDVTARLISIFIDMRDTEKAMAFWTLDAGPNLHILYTQDASEFIQRFHKKANEILSNSFELLTNTSHEPICIGNNAPDYAFTEIKKLC